MPNLYRIESSDAKYDAQRNLSGRTHYVDDDTLRFHKARILRTYHAADGLLLGLIESYAVDMHNTRRAFRHVIFDVFGTVLSRPQLEDGHNTRAQAEKAMAEAFKAIDAKAHTLAEIEKARTYAMQEYDDMRAKVEAMK